MKRYSFIFFLASFLGVTSFTACEEEATLDGATEVYITIDPMDINLKLGDTVRISATVTNVSGKVIETPVSWSIEDQTVAALLGDTAVVALDGGQEKETRLKAMLENGKYALTTVTVSRNLPDGVMCIPNDSTFTEMTSKRSYNTAHDSVLFSVSPKELLYDYDPVPTLEGLTAFDPVMTVDTVRGLVAVHYAAPRASGKGKVTLSIGDASTAKSASCDIMLAPQLLATFYGKGFENMPYINTRPSKEVLSMYFAYTYEAEMDINSEDTVRIAMNVQSGAKEDIEAGYDAYRWEVVSSNGVLITGKTEEYVKGEGFDAVLALRSGSEEGEAEFHCITPDTVFVATFTVKDYKTRYPVDEITADLDLVTMPVGGTVMLRTGVVPASSYAYHKPVVKAADPSKVEVGAYSGDMIPIKGLALGETELILTANGKEKRIPVKVTEGVLSVLWEQGNVRTLFEGQTAQWGVDVRTTSGSESPYDVTWISTDDGVLTAKQSEGDNKHGTITAVSAGKADVTAEVAGVSSEVAEVKVIALPVGLALNASNTQKDNSVVYDEGDDLVVFITPASGAYGQIMLTLADAYAGGAYDGHYDIPAGTVVDVDGARAEVTGTLDIANGSGETTVSFSISGSVGSRTLSIEADSVPVSL